MRYFVSFKPNCSLHNKFMVFQDLSLHTIHEFLVQNYPLAFDSIMTEPEAYFLISNLNNSQLSLVKPYTQCIYYDVNTQSMAYYPVLNQYGTIPPEKEIAILDGFIDTIEKNPSLITLTSNTKETLLNTLNRLKEDVINSSKLNKP